LFTNTVEFIKETYEQFHPGLVRGIKQKMRFLFVHIFNDLLSMKMVAHTCAIRSYDLIRASLNRIV
jgi:hypothetical protein